MSKITLDPYIFFTGNCREAMEFYRSIFGGRLDLQTYDEVPGEIAKEMKGKVMHATLTDGRLSLMASDCLDHEFGTSKVSLSLSGSDEGKLRTVFDKLSDGAIVKYPLKKEFWGDIFGSFTDRFGIDWMVNIITKKRAG